MKTLSYVNGNIEEIKVGEKYYFGQLWDGNGDGEELLESGVVCLWNDMEEEEVRVEFKTVDLDVENAMESLVEVRTVG